MIKVFLIEDEIVIREGIHRMVPWAEYGLIFSGEAGDGEIALPMIREIKPDVVITDIKMPFMDGLELCKLVRKELPETKLVIISGYDDFKYAQEAISLGVERYLLKPITRQNFIEALEEIRAKYELENAQKTYYEKFQREIQEYEQYSRRDFFETLVTRSFKTNHIYEMANKLNLDILSQCYNIVLFSMNSIEENQIIKDAYSQDIADLQNRLELYFHNSADFILFRNQVFSYAVLIKGDRNNILERTDVCVQFLKEQFFEVGKHIDWFVCTGKIVDRLSSLPNSYEEAMRAFAFRYIERSRVLTYSEMKEEYGNDSEHMSLKNIDVSAMNPDVIINFLSNALLGEVDSFVYNYFKVIGEEALKSKMFRQYLLLNIHFSTISFAQKLGFQKEEFANDLYLICSETVDDTEKSQEVIKNILEKGIKLRDENTKGRYKSVMEKAIEFIHKNFMDETLTLNRVAYAANVSANHFSAIFSQEMKQTFIEYLTEIRMNKAKQLLRCTDKRSGEIALEVGYKDSHYFSFLFKKTQGCTPSDYRNQKGGSLCSGK